MKRQPTLLIMSLLLAACVLTHGYAQEAQEPSYRTAVFQLDSSMIRFDAPRWNGRLRHSLMGFHPVIPAFLFF